MAFWEQNGKRTGYVSELLGIRPSLLALWKRMLDQEGSNTITRAKAIHKEEEPCVSSPPLFQMKNSGPNPHDVDVCPYEGTQSKHNQT